MSAMSAQVQQMLKKDKQGKSLKVFTKPFTLFFKKVATEQTAWIKINDLDGLKQVVAWLEDGTLEEMDRLSTLEMQLWGHLAEHSGFLRLRESLSPAAQGLMVLGNSLPALHDEFTDLFGSGAIDVLAKSNDLAQLAGKIQRGETAITDIPPPKKHNPPLMRGDGVNLTEAGEKALIEMVIGYPGMSEQDVEARKRADNELSAVMNLWDQTPPGLTSEEIDKEITAHKLSGSKTEVTIPVDSDTAEKLRQGISTFRGREEPKPISDQDIKAAEEAMTARHRAAAKLQPFVSQEWLLRNIFELTDEQMKLATVAQKNLDGTELDPEAGKEPIEVVEIRGEVLILRVNTEGLDAETCRKVIADWKQRMADIEGVDWVV